MKEKENNIIAEKQQDTESCSVYPVPCTPKSPSGDLGVELRSEEMQDILTRPPHILVRSGISVICLVLVLLFTGSFFFKYPDILTGAVVITTENPPVWLVAKSSGKIRELNCADHSLVKQGEVLAVIENTAVTSDINRIKTLLMQTSISDSVLSLPPELLTSGYELGSVQNGFSMFVKSVTDYENFLSLNTTQKEKEALKLQIADHRNYSVNLRKQLDLKQEEMKIAQSAYEREKQLYQKGINSQADMENAENAWLNVQQSLQQLRTGIASDKMEMGQLQEALSQKDIQFQRDRNNLLSGLKTAYNELLAAIENWEQAFLLISPMEGRLTFNTFWKNHQFVNAGDKVLAIIPDQQGKLIGKALAPADFSGKIRTGQRVNIKLSGYPYMEYGTLQGTVETISLVPEGNNYTIDIALPDGLTTNTGKTLNFTGELSGLAEIVTDDRSLFERVLSPLQYLLRAHTK